MKILPLEQEHRMKIVWFIRVIIFFLFTISALSKLYPIESFEKQLITLSTKQGVLYEFTNECSVTIWSRVIIITELILGISFLIPFYQKRFTIPLAISMLLIFIIHLSYQVFLFGNTENCGCMGEFLPMTPVSAIIKNILSIILLIYLLAVTPKRLVENPTFHFLLIPGLIFTIFIFWPIKKTCCCEVEINKKIRQEIRLLNDRIDTILPSFQKVSEIDVTPIVKDVFKPIRIKSEVSEFHDFTEFTLNGKEMHTNLDKGKKIVCVLNSDCDHCLALAMELKTILPENLATVYFLFFNPDAENQNQIKSQVTTFLKTVNFNVPFRIINSGEFNRLLIKSMQGPPRLTILENGKIIYDCQAEDKLDKQKVKRFSI